MEEKIVKPIQSTPEPIAQEVPVVVIETPAQVEKTSPESVINSTTPYQADPLWHDVASYFNVEQGDWDEARPKLGAIVDYVAQTIKSGDPGDIMLELRRIEDQLQPPQWGEKRYTNLYKYVRLAMQKSSIDKAMNAYKRGGF